MSTVKESERTAWFVVPRFSGTEANENIEKEETLRIAQMLEICAGKGRTITLEQLEAELGLDAIPENPGILDEIQ
ncbi:hypothetical protein [Mobiluncus mulieris]|uniref:hypothetical protein n=1 Tax=Mobiluncus mulieris TaxID=2052 RepID=UPI000DF9F916|nr:hypothetical protein [Mobiluncus mulieris]STY98444.1 Uncharacterised protein [Mobiluncus mulieris]